MASKLEAARLAVSAGESVVIANGRRPNVLVDILAGKTVGTLFRGPRAGGRVAQTLDRPHRATVWPAYA